ncbi:MAG TPA: MFS transporter [Pseudorhodoplanes sp.]|jgi:MFS family permease|nr:MFS transporter [Pseudorhodoplanes sp.]
MTPTTFAADQTGASDVRAISLVGAAHFVSHIYIFALPILFPFLRAEFGVSYTTLGGVIAIFNVLTGVLQTPAGFLVDRTSARAVLIGGLLLGAVSLAFAAALPSFAVFVAATALLGLANTVYHPADYSLLSSRISAQRMSQAYSIHIFAGFVGTAVTPALTIALAQSFGWRGALLFLAAIGFAVAAALVLFGDVLGGADGHHAPSAEGKRNGSDWRLLLSAAILLNLVFFMLLSMANSGIAGYGIVALEALWNVPLSFATSALTAYLTASAAAVLVGGFISARTGRHDLVAMIGLSLSAITLIPVALWDVGSTMVIVLMGLSGFFIGVIMPSRDMLVRAVAPAGSFGKIFGFVTTGFNIGAIIAPPAFGFMMDHGAPAAVLIGTALCGLAAVPTLVVSTLWARRRKSASAR